MVRKKTVKRAKPTIVVAPFHERFEIPIDIDGAKRRFINRATNRIFENFFEGHLAGVVERQTIRWRVANALGEEHNSLANLAWYAGGDFYRCLQVIEAAYEALESHAHRSILSTSINIVLSESEIDLGIGWQPPTFVRTGARLLDIRLVNEPLRWLSDPKYKSVYEPFEKGLSHFLEAEKKPHLLADVVTDMYEAVEALAKIVTGRKNKDLSANAELLVRTIDASEHYKQILKDYISYANEFRHAAKQGVARPKLSLREVESFVYLTGVFIRLAIQK
jgi:hypothetical protein